MKKIYFGAAMFLLVCSAQAQYKKASFLNKAGRTYDVGFRAAFLSGGGGTVPGIHYSYGRDKGKHAFHWFDLEVLLPTKFSYVTHDTYDPQIPVTVTGKTSVALVYRYNFAYYILNSENSEIKLKPFVTAGVNAYLSAGTTRTYDYTPDEASPSKVVDNDGSFSYGANAGAGGIYSFSEKIGIKLIAGYNWQGILNTSKYNDSEYSKYNVFPSHPYVSMGIRFVIVGDRD
jgi:hypothetical protein